MFIFLRSRERDQATRMLITRPSRDRHDGKAGDGFGRHDARDGLEEDPSHDAEHETVNEGAATDAAVTKGVVVVRPFWAILLATNAKAGSPSRSPCARRRRSEQELPQRPPTSSMTEKLMRK